MTHAQILETVRTILRDHLALTPIIDEKTDLTHDLQLDSIQRLVLIVELENAFKICFTPADEASTHTLGDLARLVIQRAALGLTESTAP